jgi:hypothetical protein
MRVSQFLPSFLLFCVFAVDPPVFVAFHGRTRFAAASVESVGGAAALSTGVVVADVPSLLIVAVAARV